MAKCTITLEDNDDGETVNISVDFGQGEGVRPDTPCDGAQALAFRILAGLSSEDISDDE